MRKRYMLLCALGGAALGGVMIWTHVGPGLKSNPNQNTPAYRNAVRLTLVNQLTAGIASYYHNHHNLPISMPSSPTVICTSSSTDCAGKHYVDLSFLVTGGNYVQGVPEDPLGGGTEWNSGLMISQNGETVTITAPKAELGQTITASASL